jgi:hypothetical protein
MRPAAQQEREKKGQDGGGKRGHPLKVQSDLFLLGTNIGEMPADAPEADRP